MYLDRQRVACGKNQVISSFKLQRDWSHKYHRYVYTCYTTPYRCYPRTFHTRFTYDGRVNAIYMDRQNVKCPYQDFINYFHLNCSSHRNKCVTRIHVAVYHVDEREVIIQVHHGILKAMVMQFI